MPTNKAPVLHPEIDRALTTRPEDLFSGSNPGELVSAITNLNGYITDVDSAGEATNLALNAPATAASLPA